MKPFFTRAVGRDAEEAFNGAKRQVELVYGDGVRTIAKKATLTMVETRGAGQSSTPSTYFVHDNAQAA